MRTYCVTELDQGAWQHRAHQVIFCSEGYYNLMAKIEYTSKWEGKDDNIEYQLQNFQKQQQQSSLMLHFSIGSSHGKFHRLR